MINSKTFKKLTTGSFRFLRTFDRKFFDGPAIFNYPGRGLKGYRSVNLMVARWIQAFFLAHFTPAGRILFLATGYFLLGGMLSLLMPIYYLAITMSALFVLDFLIGWFLRPRLSIKRFLPVAVRPNKPFRVDYVIENLVSSGAWDVYVDTIPMRHGVRLNGPQSFISFLAGHDSLRVSNEYIAAYRGRFRFPLPIVDSAFPFGLWRWGSRGPADKPILVYPEYSPLKFVKFPADYPARSTGTILSSTVSGHSMELLGCREFQYGDSAKYIHAQSSARLRQPIIKEFCNQAPGQILLFIDTFAGTLGVWSKIQHKSNKQFEACMSLVAAVSEYLLENRYRINLYTIDSSGCNMAGDNCTGGLSSVLETLAAMNEADGEKFPSAVAVNKTDFNGASFAICFLLGWDRNREAFIQYLTNLGVMTKLILVSNQKKPVAPQEVAGERLLQSISADEILQGRVTEI